MAISFTRAIEVAPGEAPTSLQQNKLARAINDRLRSGIGDGAYRIAMWWFNLFRQVRLPDESGFVFPAQGEFWEIYQGLDPERDIAWPVTPAGGVEGANLANPIMQFVFGIGDTFPEYLRLAEDGGGPALRLGSVADSRQPQTWGDFWELGKLQRGVIDPETGLQNVPALAAAQSATQFAFPSYSPHGKSYGGYFPTPVELLSSCGSAENTNIPSYQIKFTALRADVSVGGYHGTISYNDDGLPSITYAGSCPEGAEFSDTGHVLGIFGFSSMFYVVVSQGPGLGYWIDAYEAADWVEGPYTGEGHLQRADGGHLPRMVAYYAAEFRGSPGQRVDTATSEFEIENVGFDFQEFMTRQYLLAPAIGRYEAEQLQAIYPVAAWRGPAEIPQGTDLEFVNTGTGPIYFARPGFVLAGVYVRVDGLFGSVTVELRTPAGELKRTLKLTAADNGVAETAEYFKEPWDGMMVRIPNGLRFSGPGQINVEFAELLEYKPQVWDAYMLLRLFATKGGDEISHSTDNRGIDVSNAPDFWSIYKNYGVIANPIAAGPKSENDSWVNFNPVFDTARRLSREMVHIIPRRQFLSYEVTGGKSIVRFKRYAFGMQNEKVDLFWGLAPAHQALTSGELMEGETYIVRATSGYIVYQGAAYVNEQSFTAGASADFQESGDAKLYVRDGIRRSAIKRGATNQWVCFLQTHRFTFSNTSLWKADAYGDYYTWNNRCHFHSGSANHTGFRRHVNYNHSVSLEESESTIRRYLNHPRVQAEYVAPEAPTGYNYAHGSNNAGSSEEFFKSCLVYQPPYEVESATVEFEGGEEIVKLVFTGRFHSHEDAPASVSSDPTAWSSDEVTALWNEDYRTDDNALREYMRLQVQGRSCSVKTGDNGTNSSINGNPDNPFGSCLPHFMFVRLEPEVYEDRDDSGELSDARGDALLMAQMEIRIRAMCEGFVDGVTTSKVSQAAGEGRLFDYRFENLCLEAFGGRHFSMFPESVRPDQPFSMGPMPNTIAYAEVFNQYVRAVNLLTTARVMLPWELECTDLSSFDYQAITPDWPAGPVMPCDTADPGWKVLWTGTPPSGLGGLVSSLPGSCDSNTTAIGAATTAALGFCLDGGYAIRTNRSRVNYNVKLAEGWQEAIPLSWRDQISSLGGFLALETKIVWHARVQATSVAESDCCEAGGNGPGCTPFLHDGTIGWRSFADEEVVSEKYVLISSGTLDAGNAPPGTFTAGRGVDIAQTPCANFSQASTTLNLVAGPGFFITVPLI
ncbi:MAG TPA: hypothetical protein VEH27_08115 [Methylomirabilota bacterium]|nr:hypothetical protein [Methylomirabilota bacterium]